MATGQAGAELARRDGDAAVGPPVASRLLGEDGHYERCPLRLVDLDPAGLAVLAATVLGGSWPPAAVSGRRAGPLVAQVDAVEQHPGIASGVWPRRR